MSTSPHTDLRDEVLALADIAKACPENLQEKCFELLLDDLLSRRRDGPKRTFSQTADVGGEAGERDETGERLAAPPVPQ